MEVSRIENRLFDGTWSLGQARLYNFRKKLKRENDHKVQKRRVKLSGGNGKNEGT